MAYTRALHEIVAEVRKSKNVKIKADILKQHESTALIDLLQLTYNPTIQWLLPEGDPPYEAAEGIDEEGNGTDLEGALIGQMRKMKYFISVDGNALENVQPAKREVVFIRLLETIAPKDAKLVLEMKHRNIKGISPNVVTTAFPQVQVK